MTGHCCLFSEGCRNSNFLIFSSGKKYEHYVDNGLEMRIFNFYYDNNMF
uniref:Uncharacterized protein n=1 Tax=Romanomermis culicivorax TaxID=13658 RepID=A0A915JCD2_ROMCU